MTGAFGMVVVVIKCGWMYAQSSAAPEPSVILLRVDLVWVGVISGTSNPSIVDLDTR